MAKKEVFIIKEDGSTVPGDISPNLKCPIVHDDGSISNIDLTIANRMSIKKVRDEKGNLVFYELRPGRCIFCGGKKCTRHPGYMFTPGYWMWGVFFCKGKSFRGKDFARKLEEATSGRLRKGRCPRCDSGRVEFEECEVSEWKGRVQVNMSCTNCGFASKMFLAEGKNLEQFMNGK